MRKRTRVALVALACILLLAVVYTAAALAVQAHRIGQLRPLTMLPTIETEPRNRASYYLAAAKAVVNPPTGIGLPSDYARHVEPSGPLLDSDREVLRLMFLTKDLTECRMPVLYKAGASGGFEFRTDEALLGVGELLARHAAQLTAHGDFALAAEAATVNLRFGRDVSLGGSGHQATAGMDVYELAIQSLAALLTQQRLDVETLEILKRRLSDCLYPANASDALMAKNIAWIRLLHYDANPWYPKIVRALHLDGVVDVRGYNYSLPAIPDLDLPRLQAEAQLLSLGVAVQEFRHDLGRLPASLDELVPQYLPAVPSNEKGVLFSAVLEGDSLVVPIPPDSIINPSLLRLTFHGPEDR